MIINLLHYVEDLDIEVELECNVFTEHTGIGSYEYGGIKGFDNGDKYSAVENIKYDRSKFSEDEQKIIDFDIMAWEDEIEDRAIEIYEDAI